MRRAERGWIGLSGAAAWVSVLGVLAILYFILREALLVWTQPLPGEALHPAHLWWGDEPGPAPSRPYVWQPVALRPKCSIVPLLLGSTRVSLLSLAVAWPLGSLAAFHVTRHAHPAVRTAVVAVMELLDGVPTVVLGAAGLLFLATPLQQVTGAPSELNACLAAVVLGLWSVPLVFRMAADGLSALPSGVYRAARALGIREGAALVHLALPAGWRWFAGAGVAAFARAFGETMIPVMLTGNAAVLSLSPLDSARTLAGTIAAEMGSVVYGSTHYSVLFMLGAILLAVSLAGHELLARLTRPAPPLLAPGDPENGHEAVAVAFGGSQRPRRR